MRIAVTGSIATDHLMTFPGRIVDQLLPDQLQHLSLSFLADDLVVRRGGVAANIAVGLGRFGLNPLLVGAAGFDFAEYEQWLHASGVDTELVRVSRNLHTARFVCTTDADQNQIATFYPGAMTEAREITLAGAARRLGGLSLVVVAPNDPQAMLRHTDECRRLGIPFAADPSQQLARLSGHEVRQLVSGARLLFTNRYEAALLAERTGWTEGDVLEQVGAWITTAGADGVTVATKERPTVRVRAVPSAAPVDPTGVGDAFRAGFLAGTAWNWPYEQAARLGCALATVVLESVGAQDYGLALPLLTDLIRRTYGSSAAAEIESLFTCAD
ncbi:carbohydrate kinase family protein [Streptacidiphilus anmyonensis]|uniref:carbohydrate kinase family protein n=1 Tax=Streptacidiphilus anmyonensis TaxID=405782 RepID=UPI0005A88586|nr:carbohydrate kinase family protein [Streptacidiphilus anmyonensis]